MRVLDQLVKFSTFVDPKAHCTMVKIILPDRVLSHMNPLHVLQCAFFMIQYNILPSMLRASIRHTYQNPLCKSRLPLARHMPCQFHPPWSGEEYKLKGHNVQISPAFSYSLPFGGNIFLSTVCEHLRPVVLPQCKKLTQRKQQAKFQSGILQFVFW